MTQAATGQRQRSQVCFEIESGDLGCESRIVCEVEYFRRKRRRTEVLIEQEHFLFSANPSYAAFDLIAFNHEFKRTQILQQRLHKGLRCFFINFFDVMCAHEREMSKNDLTRDQSGFHSLASFGWQHLCR